MNNSLIRAMLLGDLNGLPEDLIFLYARTGLIHLFSASGFHMAAAIGLSNLAGRIFSPIKDPKIKEVLKFLLSLFAMTFFGNLTAWSSPMVRAYTYTALRSLAKLLGYRENKHWVFMLSLLCASVLGKGSTLSFLLSACGMAGVIYLPSLWGILFGPWLATLPISIFYFHIFSFSSLFWNLTIGSLITFISLPLGIISLFFQSTTFLHLAEISAIFFTKILSYGDQWIGLNYWVPRNLWLATIVGLYFFWKIKHKSKYLFLLILLFVFLPDANINALNIGQGDAILLRGSELSLMDTGPRGRQLNAELANLGISKINNLLISHPDLDHRGGLDSFLVQHKAEKLWLREESLYVPGGQEIIQAAERADLPIYFLDSNHAPKDFQCWLSPLREKNDLSPLCLAQLKNGKKILLTGDMSGFAEKYYLQSIIPFPTADYLKVAHHGSKYSSSEEFIKASDAKYAIISVGKNRYGHPHPSTLERLEKQNVKIYRTDLGGTLRF